MRQTACTPGGTGAQCMIVAERLVANRIEVVDLVNIVRWAKRKDARAFCTRDRKHFLVWIEILRVPLCTIAEKFHRDLVCRSWRGPFRRQQGD